VVAGGTASLARANERVLLSSPNTLTTMDSSPSSCANTRTVCIVAHVEYVLLPLLRSVSRPPRSTELIRIFFYHPPVMER
jgi:hypothetical protein